MFLAASLGGLRLRPSHLYNAADEALSSLADLLRGASRAGVWRGVAVTLEVECV